MGAIKRECCKFCDCKSDSGDRCQVIVDEKTIIDSYSYTDKDNVLRYRNDNINKSELNKVSGICC